MVYDLRRTAHYPLMQRQLKALETMGVFYADERHKELIRGILESVPPGGINALLCVDRVSDVQLMVFIIPCSERFPIAPHAFVKAAILP
jgi:hypothetical protein